MKRPREQVRLNNLEILIAEAGSATHLAHLAGTSASYLSQVRRGMLSQRGTPRGLGNDLAIKLEIGMDKPAGWMDEPHEAVRKMSGKGKVRSDSRRVYAGEQPVAVNLPHQDLPFQFDESSDANSNKPLYPRHKVKTSAGIVTLCPLISWAQACEITFPELSKQHSAEEILPCPIPCSQSTFVLRIKGVSMEPGFGNRDLIFVDPEVLAESGKYVVVKLEDADEAMFRQLIIEGGRKYLKALNPDWPDRIVEIYENTHICGVVVFKGKMI